MYSIMCCVRRENLYHWTFDRVHKRLHIYSITFTKKKEYLNFMLCMTKKGVRVFLLLSFSNKQKKQKQASSAFLPASTAVPYCMIKETPDSRLIGYREV